MWLATELPDAQINAIARMIDAHGRLPSPEEIRERAKQDPRYLGPDALFRFERSAEAPAEDEGFAVVERRVFERSVERAVTEPRALILDFDDLLVSAGDVAIDDARRERIAELVTDGWLLFAQAWRPQIARGEMTSAEMDACFERARELLGIDVELACCPHDAGPPVCWCRKPIPGHVLDFAFRRGVALGESLVVARSAADRTMAERLRVPWKDTEAFFSRRAE